jgi:hypothetical protein
MMFSVQSPKKAPERRTRKSMAHVPSSDDVFNKENTIHSTTNPSKVPKSPSKKLRSKSLGVGELKALKESTGNSQKVA